MLDLIDPNRFITTDPRRSAALCAIMTSNIGMNQVYSDFMTWRTPCDITTLFKPAANARAWCTLDAIAQPMVMACFSVNAERLGPTAAAVVTGVEGMAVASSSGPP
jgi:hypothetical protein